MSSFWIGERLNDFLFKGLDSRSWEGLTGICIGLLSVALLYEALHLLKQFHLNRFLKIRKWIRSNQTSILHNRVPSSETVGAPRWRNTRRDRHDVGSGEPAPRSLLEETDNHDSDSSKVQLSLGNCPDRSGFLNLGVSSILHSIYVFIGFTLMNAVMTFNVWIMISICLGIGLGYFFFGNYRRVDHLMNPYETETTSLNESEPANREGTPQQAGTASKRNVRNNGNGDHAGSKSGPSANTWGAGEPDPLAGGDFESSRLIVGAQVHTPRVVSSISPIS